ncbi:class I SAM-dependent RNA methyltransferase [Allonocardiopsis opalescens]
MCVARHDGRVVFVRHALPGERVRARITDRGSRFLRADAVEILSSSPDRVTPPCPFAGPGRCGGCDWQHASLDAQRRLKAEVVAEQLRRVAGIEREVTVEELPGAADGLGWRTRVQFAVDPEGRAGLRRHRSHDIEPIDRCLIAHQGIDDLDVPGRSWPGVAAVEAVTGAATGDRAVIVTPTGAKLPALPQLGASTALLRSFAGRGRRGGAVEPVRGRRGVRERAAGRDWRVTGSGFWQVHPGAADTLTDAVLKALDPQPGETHIDLYCGAGLFAGALAERVGADGRVLGVESAAGAVKDAEHNLRDLPQVRVERGDAAAVLGGYADLRVHGLVLDPPRAGAGRQTVDRIAQLRPNRVAYVSCDPATLARDLGYFADHGYRLTDLRAFDAFPMTQHVECLAVLAR